ncbi:PREDICTED: GDSL esterase/lipase At5g45960-like [Camelina sativa]|uniref:GDSL esterase/lipase At5g45960-like n=1 Tax=Camelina sativa TaxID=90675 RepID=A0ABM1R972_CAMSA|nr:PREDICTED: GDSL esterase/lipase At5g45960-like [Camelina sativa]
MRSHQTHSSSAVSFIFFLFLLFSPFSFSTSKLEPVKRNPKRKQSVSAILIFGDSTVDPGNNNYINTIFKSDFPPYGLDFKNKIPTGRFCNGRLATDFIASYLGVKENVPPYLDPNLGVNELITGVSFASAGSGYDPLTPTITNVLDIPTQLEYFKEYKRKLESKMGKERMKKHIEEALFVVSAGTNDFVISYFIVPIRRKTFTIEAYQQFVISNLKQFIQGLWKEGARKILVAGLPPIGCLPIVITLFSGEALTNRCCIDRFSAVATNYNYLLQKELGLMQMSLAGSIILYLDVYNSLYEIIHDYNKFGFEEVSSGCCGSGYLETSFLCNPKSYVCPNTSAYVFFDSIHPSEKTYFNVFKSQRRIYDSIVEL